MKVEIQTLRKAAVRLFDHLEAMGVEDIEFDADFYWQVPFENSIDMTEIPTETTVGQFSDDWEQMQEIASGRSDTISYALVWLSALLRYVGEKVVR